MNQGKSRFGLLTAAVLLWAAFWSWTYYDASSSAVGFGEVYAENYRQLREMRGGRSDTPENRAYFDGKLLQADDLRREQMARRGNALRFWIVGILILFGLMVLRNWPWRRPKKSLCN
jgi:hypothetical protein